MAVEADNPSNALLGLFKNRPGLPLSDIDLCMPAEPPSGGGGGAPCFLPLYQSLEPHQHPSNRAPSPTTACNLPPTSTMVSTFQQQIAPVAILPTPRPHQSRKRKVPASDDMRVPSQQQQAFLKPTAIHHSALNLVDLNRRHGSLSPPQPATANNHNHLVSTGLRLASFDDDGSTVTSSRLDTGAASQLSDEISAQLLQQQHEMQQLFNNHAEQLQHALKERIRMHSQALVASVEDRLSRRLRDRDMELVRIKRHNTDLEERIKQLSLETHVWQSKARSYEAMVTVLRANLQQAIMHQSREQSKLEGCGDSDADDAASAHIDENADTQKTWAMMMRARKAELMMRACKKCRGKEVTILLLPCMHLCLCQDCKLDVEKCPVCNTQKSAFIEVYLS